VRHCRWRQNQRRASTTCRYLLAIDRRGRLARNREGAAGSLLQLKQVPKCKFSFRLGGY
jgi:hypothetical protein